MYEGQQLAHALRDRRRRLSRLPGLDFQTEGNVLEHCHVIEQGVVLKNEADPARVKRQSTAVAAINLHRSGIRNFETSQDTKQRGLAGTGRAEQTNELLVADLKIDAVEHCQTLVALGQVLDIDLQTACSYAVRGTFQAARDSRTVFRISVAKAIITSSEATANEATKLKSL